MKKRNKQKNHNNQNKNSCEQARKTHMKRVWKRGGFRIWKRGDFRVWKRGAFRPCIPLPQFCKQNAENPVASNRFALASQNERAEKHKVYNLQSLIPVVQIDAEPPEQRHRQK